MVNSRNTLMLASVVAATACWLSSPRYLAAQSPKMLVIVTDVDDGACVKRIGDQVVRVECLLDSTKATPQASYRRCNERVKHLTDFHCLLFRESTECAVQRFWRQRLTQANPGGLVQGLSNPRPRPQWESHAVRTMTIHAVLSAKFPQQRPQLDANLRAELKRLYATLNTPEQLARSK